MDPLIAVPLKKLDDLEYQCKPNGPGAVEWRYAASGTGVDCLPG